MNEHFKIIFLDFDGVLNHELFYRGLSSQEYPRLNGRPYSEIDTNSVNILNRLIQETGAKVVVSSTWRRSYDKNQLQKILNKHNFIGEVIDTTPILNFEGAVRGNEVKVWLEKNYSHDKRCAYICLDDDSDFLYGQRNNLILVDSYCGLSPNNVYRATKILNK